MQMFYDTDHIQSFLNSNGFVCVHVSLSGLQMLFHSAHTRKAISNVQTEDNKTSMIAYFKCPLTFSPVWDLKCPWSSHGREKSFEQTPQR
jgi:hypothetical protein